MQKCEEMCTEILFSGMVRGEKFIFNFESRKK